MAYHDVAEACRGTALRILSGLTTTAWGGRMFLDEAEQARQGALDEASQGKRVGDVQTAIRESMKQAAVLF